MIESREKGYEQKPRGETTSKGGKEMRRSVCSSMLVWLLLMMIHVSLAWGERKKEPITQEDFEQKIENLPWVIQGRVTNVHARFIDTRELRGGPAGGNCRQVVVTEVIMEIEKMIAGEYNGHEIKIILQGQGEVDGMKMWSPDFSPMKINVGDRAIVGIVPNTRGTGINILNRTNFFKLDGTNLIPYQEEYYLAVDNPLEVIARKAKEREMPEIFKAADLICMGTVTRLIDPDMPSRKIVVSIDETLKGASEKSEITIDVSSVWQPFGLQKPGYKVMLFLKRNNSEYTPVAGGNGYYVIEGDKISRGHTLPLRTSVRQLKSNIKKWKEVEQ